MINFKYITTRKSLYKVFYSLGIKPGMSIMVHSAMSSLGYVVNGAEDVIDSLLSLVGEEGTLLFPAHSGHLTDPIDWKNPPIPKQWVKIIRENMKPFDPNITPIRNRGIIAQTFLNYPNIYRSNHPLNSVMAKGRLAKSFTSSHFLHASEGLGSPIHKLYLQKGYILLIGVSLKRCTAIHLSEFLVDVPYLKNSNIKVLHHLYGFVKLEKYPNGSEYFDKIFPYCLKHKLIKTINFHGTDLYFFRIDRVVDYAVKCLRKDPNYFLKP